jgi:prepilin-type N-terminal cleavage/methylation domain-containing protein
VRFPGGRRQLVRARRAGSEAGFTLIEVLTVVVIIAVLAAILLATFLRARAQSTVSASKGNLRNIATALETYFTDTDQYPPSLDGLVPTYSRAIPGDPCTNEPYEYDVSMGGSPPTDYKLSTIAYPLTNGCRIIVPGISYSPAGGLADTP